MSPRNIGPVTVSTVPITPAMSTTIMPGTNGFSSGMNRETVSLRFFGFSPGRRFPSEYPLYFFLD